jgi:hypothetical protein
MLVTGMSLDQFREIVETVSTDNYGGNVILHPDYREYSGTRFRARIRTVTGRGPGARRTWRGAHYPVACWHAYRDVLAWIFRMNPDARVEAGNSFHVVYRGAASFAEQYPGTGRVNIGSKMEPVTMPELCDCTHEEAYTQIEPDPAAVALISRLGIGGFTRYDDDDDYAYDGDAQGTPDLLDRISALIDGDPWNPAHP